MFYKKASHKILSKFTCNLIEKETPTQVHRCISVNLVKFFKKPILQNTYEWLVLDFAQFYIPDSIIYFIKRNSKKENYYFLNVFNRLSTSENYRQKKLLGLKMQLFGIFSSEKLDLKSFIRAWDPV